ncbi:MAG: Coenzyme F420 hydrogenase/dehydrogenase, beta subunit C-terminal domain [Bacteroidales bacterium]|nr:Coenzyme F420 hydrogenase/dehydrogenase, beta subunit C-terminal domain [Bacteroidales bacterium]
MKFETLRKKVIKPGLCTHCGTCVGLSNGVLHFNETSKGPLPDGDLSCDIPDEAFDACPGKGLHYGNLNKIIFNTLPDNWLIGNYKNLYVGYSGNDDIRLKGASGGVITQILIYLMKTKQIDGAVVLKHGIPKPWLAEPIIATSEKEIIEASQSVYAPIPVNTILEEVKSFTGKVAFVGLPDQVASIRYLQSVQHPSVKNIEYVLGPYVGINMYAGSVLRFARSNGIKNPDSIKEVKYRDGEWPGYLRITTHDNKTVKAEKFYYNYLLPFYITRSTLYSIDFTNDLTDISVGDAWNPVYEKEGKGFAVVIARNEKAAKLLQQMKKEKALILEEKLLNDILNMHGHMLDFKKRGAFVRMSFRKALGRRIPDYGIWPKKLGLSRYLVEVVIFGVIVLCSNRFARFMLGIIPISVIGRFFNFSRKSWKNMSKPTKRKGLSNQEYIIKSTTL